jgi:chemotaxis signal transduction protein
MILHREKTLPLINLAYFLEPVAKNIDITEDMAILVAEFAKLFGFRP